MTERQLELCPNFSHSEIKKANGKLSGIDFETFMRLQNLRIAIKRRIYFQINGINSGNHFLESHPKGKAYDIYFDSRDGIIAFHDAISILKKALLVGFNEIGLYWNGIMYSFHFGRGSKYRFWSAEKKTEKKDWAYHSLIVDPKKF